MEPPILQILHGDCLEVLADLDEGIADLAYLDPPFNTGRAHVAKHAAFDDRFDDVLGWIDFMQPRLRAVVRVLQPDGAVLLHCDWRTSHHARLLLDEIVGAEGFVNHLVWAYGLGGSSPRRFARKHDDILYYAKSANYHFDPPLVPATSNRMRGQMKKATDVIEIPAINNMAAERVGYPTQKPLALLEMLIGACCPPGGLVLDPLCGSGTTVVAARAHGRRAIGIDASADAVAIANERIAASRREERLTT